MTARSGAMQPQFGFSDDNEFQVVHLFPFILLSSYMRLSFAAQQTVR